MVFAELRARFLGGAIGCASAGGAIERGVSGAACTVADRTRTILFTDFFTTRSCFLDFAIFSDERALAGRRLLAAAFCAGLLGFRATLAAVDRFRTGDAEAALLFLLGAAFGRNDFLALVTGATVVRGFFANGGAFLEGDGRLVLCLIEAERFETWVEDLRRTAGTRLLILAGFQRERLGRGLRARRRLLLIRRSQRPTASIHCSRVKRKNTDILLSCSNVQYSH
jgi:hypothetical protein